MLPILRSFTPASFGFSAKTFAAAVLALYIAFRLDLDQPSWALTTVYVVAQPYAGMVVAKSFYRLVGTVLGAIVSLVFVALFSNAPELFCLALALWIGGSTFLSIYLRDDPHAYAAVLAGYSAAIIGLPAALAPEAAFEFATARCLEISIGIACGTLVHHLVFPQQAGTALLRSIDATLPALARWTQDAFTGRAMTAAGDADRRRVIGAVVGLDALRVYAILDTPALRRINPAIRQLEGRLLSILALLVSVSDRMAMLRSHNPAVADALQPALDARAAQMGEGALHAAAVGVETGPLSRTPAFLVRSILMRCDDILQLWREARLLEDSIRAPSSALDTAYPEVAVRRYRDVRLALIGGMIACLAILASSAFWIATAWTSGTTAVTFAGVICAIMAARDNPVAITAAWLRVTLVGGVLSALALLVILPQANSFETLVLAIAPFYLIAGAMLPSAATAGLALPAIFVCSALMNLSNHMVLDFAAMLNGLTGIFIGILIAHVLLGIFRPIGTEWLVAQIVAGVRADLAGVARMRAPPQHARSAFESRMFDRINALLLRLTNDAPSDRSVIDGCLAGVRVGLNLLLLNRSGPGLPPALASSVQRAALAVGEHMEAGSVRSARLAMRQLNAAANALDGAGREELQPVLDALLGIDTTLSQHAAFFGLEEDLPPLGAEVAA